MSSSLVLVPATAHWPKLTKLTLSRVELDAAGLALIERHASTLTELTLFTSTELGPDALPPLPKLRSLEVPASPHHRAAWIEFAVESHPMHVSFAFPDPKRIAIEPAPAGYLITRGARKRATYEARGTVLGGVPRDFLDSAPSDTELSWSVAGGIWSAKSTRREPCEGALSWVAARALR